MGAYFHQDWLAEYGSWQAAVDLFQDDVPRREIVKVVAQIDLALTLCPDEEQLRSFILDEMDSNYDPREVKRSVREWLEQIRLRLESQIQPRVRWLSDRAVVSAHRFSTCGGPEIKSPTTAASAQAEGLALCSLLRRWSSAANRHMADGSYPNRVGAVFRVGIFGNQGERPD
jgi:hypothetical protein